MEDHNYKTFQTKVLNQVKSGMLSPDQETRPSAQLLRDPLADDMSNAPVNKEENSPNNLGKGYAALEQILPEGAAERIIGLYASGNSTREISNWMETNMGKWVSAETINNITDSVLPEMQSWRNRPLDAVYPIVWVDAIHYKVMDDKNLPKTNAVHSVLAIDRNGHKDLMGIYVSAGENPDFWLSILTDLKNRGVSDILIACSDSFTDFSDAAKSVFPETFVQNSIVHLIRNSLKYAASKNRKELLKDLKKVYQAENKEKAEQELNNLNLKWGESYPIVIKSWLNNWHKLSDYFQYPEAIRKIIYTTNAVEGYHDQIRKVIKSKGIFVNNLALEKLVYLAYRNVCKKWTMPLSNWGQTAQQMAVNFSERFNLFA